VRPLVTIWAALLGGVGMMTLMAWFVGAQVRHGQQQPLPLELSYAAVALGVCGPVAGHLVRRVMDTAQQQRFVLSFALAEAGAMFGGVMWMLTGTTLALGGLLAGAAGLASLFPSRDDG
jgi:hypothetical protein